MEDACESIIEFVDGRVLSLSEIRTLHENPYLANLAASISITEKGIGVLSAGLITQMEELRIAIKQFLGDVRGAISDPQSTDHDMLEALSKGLTRIYVACDDIKKETDIQLVALRGTRLDVASSRMGTA
jgi:L-cysteine desulfidase